MAFDTATFKKRTVTAIVFALVMLTGLLVNRWSFVILFTVIHFGCWYEYIRLVRRINALHPIVYFLYGIIYITIPVCLIISLRLHIGSLHTGISNSFLKVIPCGIIFSIWINDTMAYITGSFIGKTPLSRISPKKTWEGTVGGAVLTVVIITWVGWLTNLYQPADWMIISATSAFFGTIGDLIESKLKRLAGVKDSGTMLPGHGGFLDRFDSLLVAIPFVWCYVYFMI
ncbi:MAG: phosphatidate cytidylyltransferase [Ginsengibacter sp.]